MSLRSLALFLLTVHDPSGKALTSSEETAEQVWIGQLEEAVKTGFSSPLYRKSISSLLFEWTQKNVPHEREAGFQQAVLKIVRSNNNNHTNNTSGTGGATASFWFGDSTSATKTLGETYERVELLRFLVGQVQANRLLEYRVFEHANVAADVTEIIVSDKAKAGEILLCDVVGKETPEEAAKYIKSLSESVLHSSSSSSSSNSEALAPVFDSAALDKLTSEQWKLLEELRSALQKEYTERRRCARSRFAQSLLTLSTSTSASLDKTELRRRGDLELSLLGETPNVGTAQEELRAMRRVELLELVGGVRSREATGFKLRSRLIPEVPDRGGRVNTHNFDRKVNEASAKADRDMKGKSHNENRQRHNAAANMHADANMGVGLGVSSGMFSQNSSSSMFSQQSNSFAPGGAGGGGSGVSNQDVNQTAEKVRGRGGRWSGNQNRGGTRGGGGNRN